MGKVDTHCDRPSSTKVADSCMGTGASCVWGWLLRGECQSIDTTDLGGGTAPLEAE